MATERAMKAAERLEEIVTFPRLREGVADLIDSAAGITELEAKLEAYAAAGATFAAERDAAVSMGTQLERERDSLQKRLDAVIDVSDYYAGGASDADCPAQLAKEVIRRARGEE
jgi:hypothetical protein